MIIKNIFSDETIGPSIRVLLIALGTGVTISLIVFLFTFFHLRLWTSNFCITNSCIKHTIETFDQSIIIIDITFKALIFLITTGSIAIALFSYKNSVATTALTNHISHFTLFQDYVTHEVNKTPEISLRSVEILEWYNSIYRNSRMGNVSVSPEYIELIKAVNNRIEISNNEVKGSGSDFFRYKIHQTEMIKALSNCSINLERLPRLAFFSVERAALNLIGKVNSAFCFSPDIPPITFRIYT